MGETYAYIQQFGCTDVGRVREHNEDAIGLSPLVGCFIVADGMGGEDAGEIASAQVVTSLKEELEREADQPGVDNLDRKRQLIRRALMRANRAIRTYVAKQGLHQSGSTAVVLALDFCQPRRALLAHVGDSRIYRMRSGALTQLTNDHSVAAAAGVTDEKEIPAMFRGMVTRAIGIKEDVDPEFNVIDIEPGDLFLLCSDGLSGMVPDRKIAKRLRHFSPHDPAGKHGFESVAKQLVDDANAGGGKDNISVVLVYIGEGAAAASADVLAKVALPPSDETYTDDPLSDSDPLGVDSLASQEQTLATRGTAKAVSQPAPAPMPERVKTTVKEVSVDPLLTNSMTMPTSASGGVMSKERWILVVLGLVLIAFLAYMIYIGFLKETPEIDTGAFPKAPDDIEVLNRFTTDADEAARSEREMPVIDLRDGQAIRDARETGRWGVIKDAVLAGAMPPEGAWMVEAERGIALWSSMRQHPDQGYQAYVDLHRALVATGVDDLLNPVFFLAEPPQDPDKRADALCQFVARFDRQVAPMLDALTMRISDLNRLFSIRGRPLPTHLAKIVALPEELSDMTALREAIPPVKALRLSLESVANDMREAGSTPEALAALDLAVFDAFAAAAVAWVAELNRVLDTTPIRELEQDIESLPAGIQGVGRELISAIKDSITELKIARGKVAGPFDRKALETLLPEYLELSASVYAYNQWLEQVAPPSAR